MIIAVDEAIPYSEAAFARAAEIRLFSGRSVHPADIHDADALVVRSVTRVDAELLEGSRVRFVGTATIGMDHLDLAYLTNRGIHFANAAGSNANAVSEYVVAALLATAQSKGWILAGRTIGIIGVGHIGSLVETKAAALGMQVMLCDPPLRESTGDRRYGFLDDVLDADILTLHVPLTSGGRYPTRHMISREVLQHFSPRQIVINSSRGAVVCGPDLKQALHAQRIGGAILDVWEGEPRIDYGLLDLAVLGTSHIAGSSQDGKVRGTAMIFEELCRHFGMASEWDSRDLFAPPRRLRPEPGTDGQEAIRSIVLQAYDIRRDDGDLRALRGMPEAAAATGFDRLRNEYVLRPEFPHFIVERAEDCDMARTFRSLGFTVADPGCASIVRQ